MRFSFLLSVLCLGIGLLSACTPVYVPNTVHAPLLKQKGDLQASAFAGTSNFDIQAAYAITNHFALMANGNYGQKASFTSGILNFHKLWEGGIGYFMPVGKVWHFEAFSGYGEGIVTGSFEDWRNFNGIEDIRVKRGFWQGDIGFTDGIVESALATRVTYVDMRQQEIGGDYGLFAEPAIVIKIGPDYFKGIFEAGVCLPLQGRKLRFDYNPLTLSIGIQGKINLRRKDKQ